jgi:lipoprotein NlpD
MLRNHFKNCILCIRDSVGLDLVGKAVFALGLLSLLGGCSPPRGVYHTVQPGQTLYRIGQTYGVDDDDLARINGIKDPSQLKVGKRLFIPGASGRKYVPSTVTAGTAARSDSPAVQRKVAKPVAPTVSTVRTKPPTVTTTNSPENKKNRSKTPGFNFIWPVHGKMVKPFGQQGYGGRKGVEIEVKSGEKIVAAAPGRVTYSGNGIKGYGNLIILKHADDYFTVYGFNQKNLVSAGAYVSKGERIALAGSPPGFGGSRLHFEIRHGKDALNPASFLP